MTPSVVIAPVKSFQPNGYGLYDLAGNVWKWCAGWYRHDYYGQLAKGSDARNPQGPKDSFDPAKRFALKRVQRGGSNLCNDLYCSGYRVTARMKASSDSGMSHTDFRCVVSVVE